MRFVLSLLCCFVIANGIKAQSGKVNVFVDERIELLTIIQYLADSPAFKYAPSYQNDIDEYFKHFKAHNAVLLYKRLARQPFQYPNALLTGFKQINRYWEWFEEDCEYVCNNDTLALLLQEVEDFNKQTHFHKFYNDHSMLYEDIVRPVQSELTSIDIIKVMEDHYGQNLGKYRVILAPLWTYYFYEPFIKKEDSVVSIIVGSNRFCDDHERFHLDKLLAKDIIHGLSHYFCDPLIDQNMIQLKNDSCVFFSELRAFGNNDHSQWTAEVYETFVHVNEMVLLEKLQKVGRLKKEYDAERSWIRTPGLFRIIKQYEANRDIYKTMADIMPMVLSYFHKRAEGCK